MTQRSSLAHVASRGAAASLLLQFSSQALSVLSTAVVARILTPSDYGVLGVALLVGLPLSGVVDLGMTTALTRAPGLTPEGLASAFWATVAGFGVGLAVAVCGGLAAGHALAPGHGWLVATGAVGSLLIVPAAAPRAVLARSFRFGRFALTDFIGVVAGALATLVLAVAGAGAWSLVIGISVRSGGILVSAVAFSRFLPKPQIVFEPLRPLLAFGSRAAVSATLSYIGRNVDNFVVVETLGTHELGVYQVAFALAMLPSSYIGQTVSGVGVAIYSSVSESGDRIRRGFAQGIDYLTFANGALVVTLWWTAAVIVHIVYGSQWLSAIPLLRILALAAFAYPLSALASSIMFALGRPTFDVLLQAARAGGIAACAYGGYALDGIAGIAWGVALYSAFNALAYLVIAGRLAKLPAAAVIRAFAVGGAAPGAVLVALAILDGLVQPGLAVRAAIGIVAATGFVAIGMIRYPQVVRSLLRRLPTGSDAIA